MAYCTTVHTVWVLYYSIVHYEYSSVIFSRPPSLIRPYAMIDLKTLQSQVEAERRRTSMSSIQLGSGAMVNTNASSSSHHEYEAIFDFKKKKNMASSMVKNDFQCVVQQHSAATRYNSCFSTIAEEANQYVDLNRSF